MCELPQHLDRRRGRLPCGNRADELATWIAKGMVGADRVHQHGGVEDGTRAATKESERITAALLDDA